MTRQEAIAVLRMVEAHGLADNAKQMAIDALEQPEIIRCKDCKHRPILENPNGEQWGFNVIAPEDSHGWDDETCPLLCEDGFYSHYPNDDDFCREWKRGETE